MSGALDNPYLEGTSNYRRRRIRNLLGFDSPEVYEGEAQLHNHELREVLTIVEDAVGDSADTSETEGDADN